MPYYTVNMVRYMRNSQRQPSKPQASKTRMPEDETEEEDYEEIVSQIVSSVADNASGIKKRGGKKRKKKRALRVTPSCVDADASQVKMPVASKPNSKDMSFDEKKLLYLRNLLRLQVERITKLEGPTPTLVAQAAFSKYEIDMNQTVQPSSRCNIYRCKHQQFPELQMLAKVYDNGGQDIENPLYFKILRHLGKKHPFIVQTWDIFIDAKSRVMVMQENANRGNLEEYLKRDNKPSNEGQTCEWARQLFKAVDYLGDMGICHRSICPHHILLNHKDLEVRLTGFYDSVLYWNVNKETVLMFPCKPLEKKSRDVPDYQAPEVFGNPEKEEFDPISADVWSYGATLYYMLSLKYPYNYKVNNPKIQEEIENNVRQLSISEEGKNFLCSLLSAFVIQRLGADKIFQQPWFSKFRNTNKN